MLISVRFIGKVNSRKDTKFHKKKLYDTQELFYVRLLEEDSITQLCQVIFESDLSDSNDIDSQ